jgi:hypothetical protein
MTFSGIVLVLGWVRRAIEAQDAAKLKLPQNAKGGIDCPIPPSLFMRNAGT